MNNLPKFVQICQTLVFVGAMVGAFALSIWGLIKITEALGSWWSWTIFLTLLAIPTTIGIGGFIYEFFDWLKARNK